jgi:hypothetical protein
MRYPNIRPPGAAPRNAGPSRNKPAAGGHHDSHTVATYLRTLYAGQFSPEWVVQELGCDPAAVSELLECWVPTVTPQILERSVGVFAAYLGIDRKRLLQLMTGGGAAPAAAAVRVESARPRAMRDEASERRRMPLGTATATRETGPRPVSVTWQKSKRSFSVPAMPGGEIPAAAHTSVAASAEPPPVGAAPSLRPLRKPV